MKKILTIVFMVLVLKAGAQLSVHAVSCGEHTYYMRVAITEVNLPVHDVSSVTCPDGSVHKDTEAGTYVECRMALFLDIACTQIIAVDPRFFAFARDFPGSAGTVTNPSIIYKGGCPVPLPDGSIYDNNFRIDHDPVNVVHCSWDCAGFYNCNPSGRGTPSNYNILINCCYAPKSLAVHLVDFNGLRNLRSNVLSWELENKVDLVRLELERSFDGVNYSVIYTTEDANIATYADRTDNTSYYRLKLLNTNNSSFLSPIILLKSPSFLQNSTSIAPLPFGNVLNVSVSCSGKQRSVFKLVSPSGQIVFFTQRDLKAGVNHFTFDLPPVAPGMYILIMSSDEQSHSIKVLKQ